MKRLSLLAAASALAGCSVSTHYHPSVPPSPASLAEANAPANATPLSAVTEEPVDLTDWWAQFGDPELNNLVARAQAQNLDRATAASRVREAQAAAAQARAALLPTVAGNAGYNHIRLGENVTPSGIGSGSSGGEGGGGGMSGGSGGDRGPIQADVFTLGLLGSYSIDVAGGDRAAARAARERVEAQVWSERDTEVTIASEVAQAYFMLRTAQARLAVLSANARSQSDLLTILAARARGGLVNEVDAARQRSQLALIQAQIPLTQTQAASRIHQIELLLALAPDTLAAELAPGPDPLAGLPRLPPRVPVGLPSTLLERRPDVRQAERQLAASVSDVDQATAQLYPRIQLTGLASFASSALGDLLKWGSRTLFGGATLSQPLFDGGSREAARRQSEERSVQARTAYQKAVLIAFSQTADSLNRYGADQRQLAVLRAGYADARRAAILNRAQYAGGLSDLTATLQAESTALQTQDQLAQAQGQTFADLVALYRALGGGWNLRDESDQPSGKPASDKIENRK